MKRIFKIFLGLILTLAVGEFFTACGGSSSSQQGYEKYGEYESSSRGGYTLNLNSSSAVKAFLSHKTFRDNDGETISFGGSASSVSIDGNSLGGAVSVDEYGYDDDGAPYAIFSFSSPFGNHTFFLTELDEDYGGRLPSKIVIFDVADPSNLYFKR